MNRRTHLSWLLAFGVTLAGCRSDITQPREDGLRRQATEALATASVSLSGPTLITASGNYTYYATASGVSPSFQWFTRTCATASVSACTVAWSALGPGTYVNPNTQSITRFLTVSPCSETKPTGPTFQVRVNAQAWQSPVVADTLVTMLRRQCL